MAKRWDRETRFRIICAGILLALLAIGWVCRLSGTVSASGGKKTDPPVLQEEIVGKVVGELGVCYVVRIEGTDALYFRTTRYNDLVLYTDGDGTPVTYSEFQERITPGECD